MLREGTGLAERLGTDIVRPRASHYRQPSLTSLPVRSCIQMPKLQGRCRIRIRLIGSADILWLALPRACGVAQRHRRLQHSPRQYPRDSRRTRTRIRSLRHGLRRQKLLESETDGRTGCSGNRPCSSVQERQARPQTKYKRFSHSLPLSDRNGVQPIGGPLPYQASVGEGYVASTQSPSQKDAQPYYRLYAQSSSGQSSSANLQTGQLNLHIGLFIIFWNFFTLFFFSLAEMKGKHLSTIHPILFYKKIRSARLNFKIS